MARNNLEDLGLLPYVTLYNEDITGGFHETDVDAVFLDLREPWLFLNHAWAALKGSGFFGSLLPTVNQAELLVAGLQTLPFGDIRDGGDPRAALEDRGRPAAPGRPDDRAQRVPDLRPEDRGRRRIADVDAG